MSSNAFLVRGAIKPVGIVALLTLFSYIFICTTLFVLLLFILLFMIYKYRNTNRVIFSNSEDILSPIDAEVFAIDHIENSVRLHCKMDCLGLKTIKSPIDGDLKLVKVRHGIYANANSLKFKKLNTQVEYQIGDINLEFIANRSNLIFEYGKDMVVKQGQTIAVIDDAIAVITLNKKHQNVTIGDKITAGQTVL